MRCPEGEWVQVLGCCSLWCCPCGSGSPSCNPCHRGWSWTSFLGEGNCNRGWATPWAGGALGSCAGLSCPVTHKHLGGCAAFCNGCIRTFLWAWWGQTGVPGGASAAPATLEHRKPTWGWPWQGPCCPPGSCSWGSLGLEGVDQPWLQACAPLHEHLFVFAPLRAWSQLHVYLCVRAHMCPLGVPQPGRSPGRGVSRGR